MLPVIALPIPPPFPDLKGQAPLRQLTGGLPSWYRRPAFPDLKGQAPLRRFQPNARALSQSSFPDLKGQAPLRHAAGDDLSRGLHAFPDLKGQAPLRYAPLRPLAAAGFDLFLTSKVRLHCDK